MDVFVQLKILSRELSPNDIENLVGISCDRSWLVGDSRRNTIIKEKSNGWVIESKAKRSEELRNHLISIFEQTSDVMSRIRSLKPKVEILLSCAIYSNETPCLYLENDLVNNVYSLGADFDIDLYIND